MDSFLGSEQRGIDMPVHVRDIDQVAGGGSIPHGTPVSESQIAHRQRGGSRGDIHGVRDPRDRHVEAHAMPSDGARLNGSADQYADSELPPHGYGGSGSIVSASQLDQRDAIATSKYGSIEDQQFAASLPQDVGAYQLTDGRYWVVMPDGNKFMLMPQQWEEYGAGISRTLQAYRQQIQHQQAQQPPSLMQRVLGMARGVGR